MGPGQGTVKLNIPDAHADFIFFRWLEKSWGCFFVIIIVALYAAILLKGFSRIMDSEKYVRDSGHGWAFDHVWASGIYSYGFCPQSATHKGDDSAFY